MAGQGWCTRRHPDGPVPVLRVPFAKITFAVETQGVRNSRMELVDPPSPKNSSEDPHGFTWPRLRLTNVDAVRSRWTGRKTRHGSGMLW